ncbi:hypothetical protein ACIOKD_01060 [Streptomyces sp. NPDC087844]|uniref:hypothetical protein n=1 Tax=Streptomyces sp. NPDC087844 TaxID=3365805 RepID=UPI0037F95756
MTSDSKKRAAAGVGILVLAGVALAIAALTGGSPGYVLMAVGGTAIVAGLGIALAGHLRK